MTTDAQQVLDDVGAAVGVVVDLDPRALTGVVAALVGDGRGVRGAAILRLGGDRGEEVARAGDLPPAEVVLAHPAGGPLLEIPLQCPQGSEVRLVADAGGQTDLALVVRAAAALLQARFGLVQAMARAEKAEAQSERLLSATQALSRTLELPEVFAAILGQLRMVVPYDSASVQQLEGTRLRIIGGDGFPNPAEVLGLDFDVEATDNPNGDVIRTRRPVILTDAVVDYPTFQEGPHLPASIRSWLGVPLEFGERLIGMLAIDSRQPGFYDDGHARIARAFAAQAAIAIENARLYGEMRRLATHDVLTGLPNRRHLEDVGTQAIATTADGDHPLSLLLVDLDRFKAINDSHGHAAGDDVLRELTDRFRGWVRPGDVLARYGGEEFVVLLPRTDLVTAAAVAERIRLAVAAEPFPTAAGDLSLTISVGVAAHAGTASLEQLLHDADDALYVAKARGRNRVEVART